ncbi:MAG: BrnT family toxin [Verrucomicrobiae bacterium]|nr:BrnT family toxin [Verrucomicrobiae bacterium]
MEFDWLNPSFDVRGSVLPHEVEESFEDPFSLRLVATDENRSVQSRYFSLGRSSAGRGIFSVYRSDGKKARVIAARPMTPEEIYFYERKMAEQF